MTTATRDMPVDLIGMLKANTAAIADLLAAEFRIAAGDCLDRPDVPEKRVVSVEFKFSPRELENTERIAECEISTRHKLPSHTAKKMEVEITNDGVKFVQPALFEAPQKG